MNSLFIDVPSPGEKLGKYSGTSRGPGCRVRDNKSRKATRSESVICARWKMAGNEVEDLASLEAKVVNQGAVVELIRRRYSQNKIYVSNILAARARFLSNSCLIAAACMTSRTLQNAMSFC